MKRLLALLLPLCLLLAGCSRNTQALQEEVDRLKQENTALLETIDQLQEQLSALQSTALESWSLDARGTDDVLPAQVLFSARPFARPDGQKARLLVMLEGKEVARADCLWDGESYTASVSLQPEDGYGYYCLLSDGTEAAEQILLSTPDSPAAPKLTYLAGSLETYANALTQDLTVQDGVIGANVTVAIQTPLISSDGTPVSLVLAKLSWQQEDQVLSEEVLNLQEGETEGSLTGYFPLRLEAPPLEDGTAIDLVLTAELSDGRVLTAVAGSWTAQEGQLESSVG